MEFTKPQVDEVYRRIAETLVPINTNLINISNRLKSLYRNGDKDGPPGVIESIQATDLKRWDSQQGVNDDQNQKLDTIITRLNSIDLQNAKNTGSKEAWSIVGKALAAILSLIITSLVVLAASDHLTWHFSNNTSQHINTNSNVSTDVGKE